MKILYCITSSSWGGAQLHVLELCQNQLAKGNEVIFAVGNKGPLLKKIKTLKGIKVYVLKNLKRNVMPLCDLKAIYEIRKIIKKEKPDIVHLHSSKAGTLGRIACINLPSKVIFTVHGWAFTEGISSNLKKFFYKKIEQIVAPLTDLFICVSEYDKKIGIDAGILNAKNAVVIHNGAPRIQNIAKRNLKNSSIIKFVMIARFSKQKDQTSLIRAIEKLPKDKYYLTFVGEGETLDENKKLTEKLGLTKNVSFVGFKSNVIPYLLRNDVYILSTHYEGLPISIIEAMSCGLPIIATNTGGNGELITDNGFLTNSIEDLEKSMKKFIDNRNLVASLGKNSLKNFINNFSLEQCLKLVNNSYSRLLK